CNDMSRQIADAMAEAAKAVSGLAREAQELSELIHEMKEG
ncbi:MAG: methyl-accepting chemotaxis protein, partial [Desulfovibrio fairfieldensis]|nr:methyl-accepting chemotaxis protein [Desulfovibrio fairfieldensis]